VLKSKLNIRDKGMKKIEDFSCDKYLLNDYMNDTQNLSILSLLPFLISVFGMTQWFMVKKNGCDTVT
jgi:hypothetical protein